MREICEVVQAPEGDELVLGSTLGGKRIMPQQSTPGGYQVEELLSQGQDLRGTAKCLGSRAAASQSRVVPT